MIPLALVGMSYREAPSAVRAALAAFDSATRLASKQLLDAGEITGVVRIESCARVEWLLASARPPWAAELFSAALIGAAENPDHVRPRVRHGAAAVGGLLRVAAGLDSVAQGEHAIGNQVLRAFERAHEAGTVCRTLHVAWRGVGDLLNRARRILPQGRTGGVQALVMQRLHRRAARRAHRRVRARRNRPGHVARTGRRRIHGGRELQSREHACLRRRDAARAARHRRFGCAACLAHAAGGARARQRFRSRQPAAGRCSAGLAADRARRVAGWPWGGAARGANSPRSRWNARLARRRSARHCSRRRRATHSRR